MDKQEIIEGNRLICIFDGWTIEPGMEKEPDPYYNRGFNMQMLSEMGYHKDWNWLMAVVKKVKDSVKNQDWNPSEEKEARKRIQPILNEIHNLNIENAHYCLVKYLQWVNKQKQ